jgi:hypothetical protein
MLAVLGNNNGKVLASAGSGVFKMPKEIKVTLHFYSGKDDDLITRMESLHVLSGEKGEAFKDILRRGVGSTASDKSFLTAGTQIADGLTSDERAIAERAMSETDGKISLEVLMNWSLGHRDARRLQADWKMRGWAATDSQRKNSLYITSKLADLLPNCQTPAKQGCPTYQPGLPNCQTGLPTRPTADQLTALTAANPDLEQVETRPAHVNQKLSINSEHW